jgi:hypothetical protein
MYKSMGIFSYSVPPLLSLRVAIDPEITRYYRSFVPKWIVSNRQMYAPHISVVRKETPPLMGHWGKYEGHEVEFEYENIVRFGEVYLWLNCFSVRLEEVRIELGLPVHSPYTLPPEGFNHCYHTTIGNFKDI